MSFARLSFAAITLAVLTAASCTGKGGGASTARANVTELLRGELWHDETCSERHFENCLIPRFSISVASVRVAGARVGAVLLLDNQHLILALSEDRGATWRLTEIDDDDYTRGGQIYVAGMDVFLTETATYLYLPRPELGAGGLTYSRGYFYPVSSTATGPVKLNMQAQTLHAPGAPYVDVRDGRAIFLVPDADFRGGPTTVIAAEVDPVERANDVNDIIACDGPGCSGLSWAAFQGSDDGDTYWGFSNTQPGGGAECLMGYSRSRKQLGGRCLPLSSWPAPASDDRFAVIPYAGRQAPVLRLFDAAGHAWAVTILDSGTGAPPSASTPVDLGAGSFFTNGSYGLRQRHPGLAIVMPPTVTADAGSSTNPLGAALETRLVQVRQDGQAQDVVLPRSPCADAATCGDRQNSLQQLYGQVAWTAPLGNDDYLVFYLWDEEPALNRFRLVLSVAREHATLRDIAPTPFVPPAGPVGFPGALESSDLEKMCVRKLSCLSNQDGATDGILVCLDAYTTSSPATAAEQHAALQDFLASGPGCTPWEGGPRCRAGCPEAGGHCVDSQAGGSCQLPALPAAACNACTAEGKAVSCDAAGAVTSVLDCAAVGQTCACSKGADGACTDAPKCVAPACADPAPACVGDVWTQCDRVRDCRPLQMKCTLESSPHWQGCTGKEPTPQSAGCDPTMPVRCDGKYLLFCANGRLHWTDCEKLGFKTCGAVPDTSIQRCRP